ncbi:MAG: cytochrome C oxidase subunit IV family protein [Chlamydiota bacterium]
MYEDQGWKCSVKPTILGFFVSLIFIYAAYRLDQIHLTNSSAITFAIIALCSIQALLQFLFFFHLGLEEKPKWNLYAFLFTTLILIIVVTGTIWILNSLDYNLMRTN